MRLRQGRATYKAFPGVRQRNGYCCVRARAASHSFIEHGDLFLLVFLGCSVQSPVLCIYRARVLGKMS